jgi:CDP-glucose 4,6-dehydratase
MAVVAEVVAAWGTGEVRVQPRPGAPREASLLHLDCDKMKQLLGWSPAWGFREAVRHTVEWHKALLEGRDPWQTTIAQIKTYSSSLAWRGVP